jgi:hypothetical protein
MIETLCSKPQGRDLQSQWRHWIFSVRLILPAASWAWGLLRPQQKWIPKDISGGKSAASASSRQLNHHLWTDCPNNAVPRTSNRHTGLHCPSQEELHFVTLPLLQYFTSFNYAIAKSGNGPTVISTTGWLTSSVIFLQIRHNGYREPKGNNNIALRRMPSSALLRRVALVRTDVSEERSASIISVIRISELGTTLAVNKNRHTLRKYYSYKNHTT